MQTKARFLLLVSAAVFLITMITLAPALFHSSRPNAEPNTAMASTEKPVAASVAEPLESTVKPETPGSLSISKFEPAASDSLKKKPVNAHTKRKPATKPSHRVSKTVNSHSHPVLLPSTGVTTVKIDNSKATHESKQSVSPWGISIIASPTGGDVGVSYRLTSLSLLTKSDLDLVVASRQAGLGISKHLTEHISMGILGAVTYGENDKQLGIYGKYTF